MQPSEARRLATWPDTFRQVQEVNEGRKSRLTFEPRQEPGVPSRRLNRKGKPGRSNAESTLEKRMKRLRTPEEAKWLVTMSTIMRLIVSNVGRYELHTVTVIREMADAIGELAYVERELLPYLAPQYRPN
jgi:hypothetical protein